jgi:RNA polymerase sigma-70 factor (ECF subfamily)
VYRLCLRYFRDQPDWAEDLTHDVFVKLMEHLPRLKDRTNLAGWLYRVTTHMALKRLKRQRSVFGRVSRLLRANESDAAPAPDCIQEHSETMAAAMKALEELPPRERVVASMKFIDGKSQQEIAEALSMSKGYVSKLVTRALSRLQQRGWEVDDVQA